MTRVDNTRVGVVSGIDVPLPPNCATATCHHREHQLRGGGWCAPTDCQTGVCTIRTVHDLDCPKPGWGYDSTPWDGTMVDLSAVGAKRGGWAMPSPYLQNMMNGRTHVETMTSVRRWWQIWKPKNVSWQEDVPCWDSDCDKDHKFYSPTGLLDMPTVQIRRGGIRHETRSSV